MAEPAEGEGADMSSGLPTRLSLETVRPGSTDSAHQGPSPLKTGRTSVYLTPSRLLHLQHESALIPPPEFAEVARITTTSFSQDSGDFVQPNLEAINKPVVIRQTTTADEGPTLGYKLYPSKPGESRIYGLSLGSRLHFEGSNVTLALAARKSALQVASSPIQSEEPAVHIPESVSFFSNNPPSSKHQRPTPEVPASLRRVEETPTTIRVHNVSQRVASTYDSAPFSTAKDQLSPVPKQPQILSSIPTEPMRAMPSVMGDATTSRVVQNDSGSAHENQLTESEAAAESDCKNEFAVDEDDDEFKVASTSGSTTSAAKRTLSMVGSEGIADSKVVKKTKLDAENQNQELETDTGDEGFSSSSPTGGPGRGRHFKVAKDQSPRAPSEGSSMDEIFAPKWQGRQYTKKAAVMQKTTNTKTSKSKHAVKTETPTSKARGREPPTVLISAKKIKSPMTPVSAATSPTSSLTKTEGGSTSQLVIAYTSSSCDSKVNIKKFLNKNGISVTDKIDENLDYLCVGKGELKKTSKLLLAVALGKPILHDQWVLDSAKAGKPLEIDGYLASDERRERELKVPARWSHGEPRHGILKDHLIYVTPALKDKYGGDWKMIQKVTKAIGAKKNFTGPAREALSKLEKEDVICLGTDKADLDALSIYEKDVAIFDTDLLSMAVLRGKLELESGEFRLVPTGAKGPSTRKR